MEFHEQIWITLLDKGLLAIAVGVLVWLGNLWLQRDKARKDLAVAIAEKRADAYATLWKKTEDLRSTDPPPLDAHKRDELMGELTKLYFKDGGAMYLSHPAASCFLAAKKLLNDSEASDKQIRKAFSALRTQMKVDLLIYSKAEAIKPLRYEEGQQQ